MDQKRIKILYGITKSNWGGAQRYVFDLATSLPKDTYETVVVIGKEGILSEKLIKCGIKVITINSLYRDINIWQDFISLIKLIRILRKEKPNIVHLNSSKMGLLGTIAGRITNTSKIIFTGHGWAFNEDRGKLQKIIITIFHYLTIKLAHKVIAVSEETRNQILKIANLKEKIVVIKNGINESELLTKELARENIIKKLPLDVDLENKTWLGTISELHKNKGLKYIIEALHLMDNPPIMIIIGEGEEREKLQERIRRYGLQKNIFMIGRLDDASQYLKAFDIFTLTSITEALPYVLLEAGLANLPTVASSVGGIPEIIEDMVSGILVRPREPEEIKQALTFLLKNPEKSMTFGRRLHDKTQRDFNLEKMLGETLALYR